MLEQIIQFNEQNEKLGQLEKNRYVIELGNWNVSGDFLEERGSEVSRILTTAQIDSLDSRIKRIVPLSSDSREVGFFVLVINDWRVRLAKKLPTNFAVSSLSDLSAYAKEEERSQIEKMRSQLASVPEEILKRLEQKGYTKKTFAYLYARLRAEEIQPDELADISQPKTHRRIFLTQVFEGNAAAKVPGPANPQVYDLTTLTRYNTHFERLEATVRKFADSYQVAAIAADRVREAEVLGITSGPGRELFVNLPIEKRLEQKEKIDFADLCRYLNAQVKNQKFAFFHEDVENTFQTGTNISAKTLNYIYTKSLLTKNRFTTHFLELPSRDFPIIFSDKDLWSGVDKKQYNASSQDYKRSGIYHYSFADLKVRNLYRKTNHPLLTGIISYESSGDAVALSQADCYEQYTSLFKTNSAIFAWLNFASVQAEQMLIAMPAGDTYHAVRITTNLVKATGPARVAWYSALLKFLKRFVKSGLVDDLINKIENIGLKNLMSVLRQSDDVLVKESTVTNRLSINSFAGADLVEVAYVENNILKIRTEGLIKPGTVIEKIEKLPDGIQLEMANGEKLAANEIELITDAQGAKWFRRLAKGGDDLASALKQFDVAGEFAKGKNVVEFSIEWGGQSYRLKWTKVTDDLIDFGDKDALRSQLKNILKTTDDIEAHHLIPLGKSNHPVIQLAAKDGFHPNLVENGLGLKKYTKLTGEGIHGNHPAYDKFIDYRLNEAGSLTPKTANEFVQKQLIPELKVQISNAQNSGLNLNEYFKQVVNPNYGIR